MGRPLYREGADTTDDIVHIQAGVLGLTGAALPTSPTCLVQFSDLHLSEFNASQYARFGDRLNDLRLISDTVLRAAKPSAVLLTGDLVDGKDRNGGGRQSSSEWQDYRSAVDAIKAGTGLEEADILDVRGNHDTFNVKTRLGVNDFFAQYSAAGRRNASARVYVRHLGLGSGGKGGCPSAVLVGIDVSREPGLAGINFFGSAPAHLLAEVDQVLGEATKDLRIRGCGGWSIIAYGHYPLEVVGHPETAPWWPWGRVTPRHKGSVPSSLRQVLLRHNVTAYLNGHLHSAFGDKLHRLHRRGSAGAYMAELETAAWLTCRRFRLLCSDGDTLSFSDLYLHSEASPPARATPRGIQQHASDGTAFSITSEEASQQVGDYIVVLTWPPNVRKSPLLHAGEEPGGHETSSVRALLVPVLEKQHRPDVKASFVLHCDGRQVEHPMEHSEGQLWLGRLGGSPKVGCKEGTAHLQVRVSHVSSSELRPVRLVQRGNNLEFGEALSPSPLDLSWFDWARSIALILDWPYWGYRAMFAVWGFLFFGLLVVPRWGVSRGWDHGLESWLDKRQGVSRAVLAWLLYPATILLDTARLPAMWNPLAVYYGYLGVGPWAVVRFLEGEHLGFYQLGRVLYFQGGRPHYVHNVDTSIATVIHMSLTLLPLTLVFASTVSRVKRMAARLKPWQLLTLPQLLLLLLALYPNWILLRRFAFANLGPAGLLVNVMAWPTPFFGLLLLRLSRFSPPRETVGAAATEYKSD